MMLTAGKSGRLVLTYGCFDQFHQGHVQFLRRVAQMGDELIVGCATDEHANRIGLPCAQPYRQRRGLLERCRYVSRVIAETDEDQQRTDIVNYNASALVMGEEYTGLFNHLQDIAQIYYLPRINLAELNRNEPQSYLFKAVS
jgi:glycerol-3-phosphate cytidylyltransferase